MDLAGTVDVMLSEACPSIRYRIKSEILGHSPDTPEMHRLQEHILKSDIVQYIFGWQKPDGYLGEGFHGGVRADLKQRESTRGAEGAIKCLAEMGVRNDHPVLRRALDALRRDDWYGERSGVCWKYYPELGLYGFDLVRAVTFANAGVEDLDFVRQQQRETVRTLGGILDIRSMDDIIEDFKDRKVFKPGIAFPESYHLRLLGRTHRWKSPDNVEVVRRAIRKLIELSPFPVVKVRHKSRWLGPAAIFPKNLRPSLPELGGEKEWPEWFHTYELFARMGVVPHIEELSRQLHELLAILEEGDGFFRRPVAARCCMGWGPYHGLALERDWKDGRDVYDLTFRCLLILHHAGRLRV